MCKIWSFKKYGDSTALLDEYGNAISYEKLNEETNCLFEAIGRRCLVFILCRNEIGSVVGYSGFLNHGVVPVLLNSHMDDEMVKDLVNIYKPDYIWIPEDQTEQFRGMKPIYSSYQYVLLKTGYAGAYPLYEELGLLLTTSGSTGSPKYVRQSYENILYNANSIVEYLKLNETERPITTLPMNYTYGLSIINSHLLVGATILLTDKGLTRREFWQFFKDAQATSFGGVPYTYEMLDKLRFYRMELPSLRTMTQAGGKILPELHEKFARYAKEQGKNFVVMYGQCEATARMGFLPPEKAIEKKGAIGIAIPGGKFRLVDEQGNIISAPNTTGELVYEGKNVTLGYAECGEDLSKGDERNGILQTGDMAQFDEDGYYYIVGRKKRFLKIYGNRVNLDETERLIKGQFNIEAACAGTDDHMIIFLLSGEKENDILDYIVMKTKLNPSAFQIMVIDEIPKNDAGKTLYRELERYYA